MKVAIACPNMWLRGSRLRKRIGRNGAVYFWYLVTSRSIGTMFARMLRWVMRTPLGSAVAPDVKMISALVSAVAVGAAELPATRRVRCGAFARGPSIRRLREGLGRSSDRFHTFRSEPSAARIDGVADEHGASVDDRGNTQQEVGGRAEIDRDQHDAFEQASPQRNDPLGAVLTPDRDRLAGVMPASRRRVANASAAAVTCAYVYDQLRYPSS